MFKMNTVDFGREVSAHRDLGPSGFIATIFRCHEQLNKRKFTVLLETNAYNRHSLNM